MTTTDSVTAGDPLSPTSSASKGPRRRRAVAAVTVCVLIALGIAATIAASWWTAPSLFSDDDAGNFSLDAQPLAAFPVYVGFGTVDSKAGETVTVNSADVHFADNSAHFTAKVFVCTQRPVKSGSLRLGVSLAKQSLSEYCTSVRSLKEGTKVRLENSSGQYFVAALTPSRAGSARVDSININYSRGASHLFQRGTQDVEQDFTIAAK